VRKRAVRSRPNRAAASHGPFLNVDPKRSYTMSRIRGRGNKSTERRVRGALVRAGIQGWELHARGVPGSPDFYFSKARLAVFIDGCFWHSCPRCYRRPKSRVAYWDMKARRNKARDRRMTAALSRGGAKVLRFWEHDISRGLPGVVLEIAGALGRAARKGAGARGTSSTR